jgi:hypothetical protein
MINQTKYRYNLKTISSKIYSKYFNYAKNNNKTWIYGGFTTIFQLFAK